MKLDTFALVKIMAAVPKGNSKRLEANQIYRIIYLIDYFDLFTKVLKKMITTIYLTIFLLQLPASWAFNKTHIYNWGGHNNGHLLKIVVCQSGKI